MTLINNPKESELEMYLQKVLRNGLDSSVSNKHESDQQNGLDNQPSNKEVVYPHHGNFGYQLLLK